MSEHEYNFDEFRDVLSGMLGVDPSEINKESVIYQDIGIDSLGLVNLGTKFQKVYDIEIPPAVMVEIRTVGEFYDSVRDLVVSKQ